MLRLATTMAWQRRRRRSPVQREATFALNHFTLLSTLVTKLTGSYERVVGSLLAIPGGFVVQDHFLNDRSSKKNV